LAEKYVVEVKNVVVSHRENVALKNISFNIFAGEFIGVMGPNGAGKTTLLNAISGLEKLVSGNIHIFSKPLNSNSHKVRKEIGYVSQIRNIDPKMPISVQEMVMMGRYSVIGLLRWPGRRDDEIVREAIELVGIKHLMKRPIGHLSGGELQRTIIAQCIVQEPRLLLLDEPIASLDWKAQIDILQLVKLIHKTKNLTTMFVSHDLSVLPTNCDRIVMIKNGLLWGFGSSQEMLTDENLSLVYDLPLSEVKRRRAEVKPVLFSG
jgi:ABC-type Mn2+/Zn2+ transport system ATPase subunit